MEIEVIFNKISALISVRAMKTSPLHFMIYFIILPLCLVLKYSVLFTGHPLPISFSVSLLSFLSLQIRAAQNGDSDQFSFLPLLSCLHDTFCAMAPNHIFVLITINFYL